MDRVKQEDRTLWLAQMEAPLPGTGKNPSAQAIEEDGEAFMTFYAQITGQQGVSAG